MAVQLNVSLQDFGAASGLAALGDVDVTPLMDQIGQLLEGSARERIRTTNIAPDGSSWKPSHRAQEDGGKTLFKKGLLAASLTHEADRRQVQVGSNLIYAGVHQDGATIVPKNGGALQFQLPNGQFVTVSKVTIPARPYLGVSDDDSEDVQDLTSAFITDLIERVQ